MEVYFQFLTFYKGINFNSENFVFDHVCIREQTETDPFFQIGELERRQRLYIPNPKSKEKILIVDKQ